MSMLSMMPEIRTFTVLIPRQTEDDRIWLVRYDDEVIGSAVVDMSNPHLVRLEMAYRHPSRIEFEEGRLVPTFNDAYIDLHIGTSASEVLT